MVGRRPASTKSAGSDARTQVRSRSGLLLISLACCAGLAACSAIAPAPGTAPARPSHTFAYNQMAVPIPGTLPRSAYPRGSAERAAFELINRYRRECGFPAMLENRILDRAAWLHASYQADNHVMSDEEQAGRASFLGVTAQERAQKLGWPSDVYAGSDDMTFYKDLAFTDTGYGREVAYGLLAAAYHAPTLFYPMHLFGIAIVKSAGRRHPQIWASLQNGQIINRITRADEPLTFPCQGTRGLPYSADDEEPAPPGTHGAFGTPIVVMGNLADTLRLTRAELMDPAGHRLALRVLDSANDPNHLMAAFAGVAYAPRPLTPNTRYTTIVDGVVNGKPFQRRFVFETGDRAS